MDDAPDLAGGVFELQTLDRLLSGIVATHPEKVAGWISDEPGCWGFLSGKALIGFRDQLGRPLTDQERRLVWHRLWSLLEQAKSGRSQI